LLSIFNPLIYKKNSNYPYKGYKTDWMQCWYFSWFLSL